MQFEIWMNVTPMPMMALILAIVMLMPAFVGIWLRKRRQHRPVEPEEEDGDSQEGFVISAVLGLLALLLGFTFALAVDRYETRRVLVLDEANAIGTSYLRAQLLEEPHRSRMSGILRDYTENRVALGEAPATVDRRHMFERNDRLIKDLWSATAASFDSIRHLDFSSSLLETVNAVVDFDTARKTARIARVPTAVFLVLILYVVATSGMLGYMAQTSRNIIHTVAFIGLLVMSLLLIIDIDGPTKGWITESQLPMRMLRETLKHTPPGTYDQWRSLPVQTPPPKAIAAP
jgi:hypothetical protein